MIHRIGIVGGGQLARMMIYRTKKLGFQFSVLDPDAQAGAVSLAENFIQGNLYDPKKLAELVHSAEATTYDIEHVGTDALLALESEGAVIHPSPRVLQTLQDKQVQKKIYQKAGLPMAPFIEIPLDKLRKSDFPVVQKTRTGGYDGRGVQILRTIEDLSKAWKENSFLEAYIPFEKELAVMVARGQDGQTQCYPVVQMTFDPERNICDEIIAPAGITSEVELKAKTLALKAVSVLGGVGIFGVEMFLTAQGDVLINEIAPRPHNSGHYTMEACQVCQFENHIRAVAGLPLGEPGFFTSAVMVNLLGQGTGSTYVEGLEKALKEPGFSLHLYGKESCRPGRKMGHFTVTHQDSAIALEKAREIKAYLSVRGA